MALLLNRRVYFINQIDTSLRLWTVKVQVVESHRTQHSTGKNGVPPRTYKRFLLVDEEGTKVSAVLYDNDIEYFANSLQPFKRYLISNAKLTPAYAYFKVGPYTLTWIISNDTPVELIDEPTVPPLPFTYDVCPFNQFIKHADKDFGFAIVVHAFPRRQVKRHTSHREFVVIDESKIPMIMTLWNSYGDIEGNVIANNIARLPVIIGVNMKATTFHGLSLGTRMYSCILIDPPLADSPTLKEWYQKNKAEIMKMLADETYKQTDLLLPPPALADTIDVPTAATQLLMNNSVWVVGKINFVASQQPYYLIACQNCNKKVAAGPNWFLQCSFCGTKKEVKLRCRVPVELTGGGKSLPIMLTSPDVERLTEITAEQLRDSHEFDFHVEDELQIALDKLEVVCFVKKYDRDALGSPGRHGVRYGVVKVYRMDAIQPFQSLPGPSSSTVNLGTSDAEKQFFTPNTKKQLTEIEDTTELNKAAPPSPLAKRALEFISTNPEADKHAATATPPIEGNNDGKSPLKKGRDKLKLN